MRVEIGASVHPSLPESAGAHISLNFNTGVTVSKTRERATATA
jgi:hypothetical protein